MDITINRIGIIDATMNVLPTNEDLDGKQVSTSQLRINSLIDLERDLSPQARLNH